MLLSSYVNDNYTPLHIRWRSDKSGKIETCGSHSPHRHFILQCNVQVPIKAVQPTENMEERFQGIDAYLTPSLLSTMQTYLSLMKLLPYEVSPELTKVFVIIGFCNLCP